MSTALLSLEEIERSSVKKEKKKVEGNKKRRKKRKKEDKKQKEREKSRAGRNRKVGTFSCFRVRSIKISGGALTVDLSWKWASKLFILRAMIQS